MQLHVRLGWWSLDQRMADARLCMLYKIVYGLVAISLPHIYSGLQEWHIIATPSNCAKFIPC